MQFPEQFILHVSVVLDKKPQFEVKDVQCETQKAQSFSQPHLEGDVRIATYIATDQIYVQHALSNCHP